MPSPSALPSSSTPPTIGRFDEHQVWTNGHERTIENSARGTRASSFSSSFFLGLDHWVILSLARARLSFTFPSLSLSSFKGREKKAAFSSRRAFLLDISLSLPLIFVKNVARGKKRRKGRCFPISLTLSNHFLPNSTTAVISVGNYPREETDLIEIKLERSCFSFPEKKKNRIRLTESSVSNFVIDRARDDWSKRERMERKAMS